MKTMRKLFRVLLALAMTLALAVPAFAAETTGSITITNPQGDHTYTAYKMVTLTSLLKVSPSVMVSVT